MLKIALISLVVLSSIFIAATMLNIEQSLLGDRDKIEEMASMVSTTTTTTSLPTRRLRMLFVTCADDRYIPGAIMLIQSFRDKSRMNMSNIDYLVIGSKVSNESQKLLGQLEIPYQECFFREEAARHKYRMWPQGNYAGNCKFDAILDPSFRLKYARVVIVDSDMAVKADLNPLFSFQSTNPKVAQYFLQAKLQVPHWRSNFRGSCRANLTLAGYDLEAPCAIANVMMIDLQKLLPVPELRSKIVSLMGEYGQCSIYWEQGFIYLLFYGETEIAPFSTDVLFDHFFHWAIPWVPKNHHTWLHSPEFYAIFLEHYGRATQMLRDKIQTLQEAVAQMNKAVTWPNITFSPTSLHFVGA